LPGVDWELVELLGVGGFGEVWKACNPHFDGVAPVALKFCQHAAARDRLLKHEAAVLNQVMRQGKHEDIVPLLHTYLSADPPCLAYEYIDGGDLAGLIQERRGGLPPQQAARVVQRLAEIVGFAHRLGPPIVHRDLKPANILMKSRTDGKLALRITDFGIGGLAIQQEVAQSRRGMKSGEFLTAAVRGAYTPLYASPQQMRGDETLDPRDGAYALGVIWYQMLTGDLTKGRPGGDAWRKRLANRGMTPALLALLASSYEEERADRPASAVVLAQKLDQLLQEPVPAPIAGLRGSDSGGETSSHAATANAGRRASAGHRGAEE
jgi:serine/threonine protein kinase